MIEALPPIWSEDEAAQELSYYPPYHIGMVNSPKHVRHHLIQNSLRLFSFLDIHLDLERRFSCLIRLGYTDRNPIKGEFWKEVNKKVTLIKKPGRSQYKRERKYHSTSASGFHVVGISGIGKSQTIEQILRLYPQVICHSKYKKKNFTYVQLVWLKLDCPFDGSIRGLCYNFFQTIDNLLETNYFEEYAKKAKNVDQMIPNMALVATNHCIGVLVIDEIQRLSKAKSGGAEAMLDFFVQLVNTIGIPVVLVGTYKALPILSGAISQMRRGTGQGDLLWDRMKYDDQWNLLMEDLWDYQYIQKKRPFKESTDLCKVIYEETQGITDLAIKLFMFAQERAITSEEEELTPSIIRSAAIDKFNLLQPALKAFKDKNKDALRKFEDAYPEFLKEELFEKDDSELRLVGAITEEPEIKTLLNTEVDSEQLCSETQMAVEDFFQFKTTKVIKFKKKGDANGILPSIFRSVETQDSENIYNAMKKAGYIKSGSEFLNQGEV